MKKITKIALSAVLIIIILIAYFVSSVQGTYKYLVQYGYGKEELSKTLAVHFGLSKGFTVEEDDGAGFSTFIGDHNYIYKGLFKKNGYFEFDRMGTVGYYNKSNDEKDPRDFLVSSTSDWCHWFRIYRISDGYKIEDFE